MIKNSPWVLKVRPWPQKLDGWLFSTFYFQNLWFLFPVQRARSRMHRNVVRNLHWRWSAWRTAATWQDEWRRWHWFFCPTGRQWWEDRKLRIFPMSTEIEKCILSSSSPSTMGAHLLTISDINEVPLIAGGAPAAFQLGDAAFSSTAKVAL